MSKPSLRHRTARCRLRAQGFSLLEILVAFVVLSIVLTVILRVLATNTRSSALATDYGIAASHAERLLATVQLDEELRPGVVESAIDEQWHWRRTVTPYLEPGRDFSFAPGIQPLRIYIEVLWTRGGVQRSVALSTLRMVRLP
jgi:general secretion pathway protein I